MKLEELLNSLIERGWKPFGEGCHRSPYKRVSVHKNYNKERTYVLFYSNNHSHWKVLRQVVSKESGLWQFCMSKGFTPNVSCYRWEKWFYDIDDLTQCEADVSGFDNYGYRLIESALKDESELEDFLLSVIKIDE